MKTQFHNMQAYIHNGKIGEVFTSYNSPICCKHNRTLYITGRYDYSRSTSRQFSRYLIESDICRDLADAHALKKAIERIIASAHGICSSVAVRIGDTSLKYFEKMGYVAGADMYENAYGVTYRIVYMDYAVAVESDIFI